MRAFCLLILFGLWTVAFAASETASSRTFFETSDRPFVSKDATNEVAREFRKLMEEDDKVLDEIDRLITENQEFAAKGAGVPNAELNRRIVARADEMKRAYEDFIRRHPRHAKARVAYGSFLGDIHDEDAAREQLEEALKMDKNDPAIYNNLANIYGHTGPVLKAFEFYDKAISLSPRESVYYQNLATTVYLFRPDATNYYKITEEQVFNKALDLYKKALALDPTNFTLATDLAQSFYGIRPMRTEDALSSWTNTLTLARDVFEQQGIHIHLARIKTTAGRYDEARSHLDQVKDPRYAELRKRLERNLERRISGETNDVAAPLSAEAPGGSL